MSLKFKIPHSDICLISQQASCGETVTAQFPLFGHVRIFTSVYLRGCFSEVGEQSETCPHLKSLKTAGIGDSQRCRYQQLQIWRHPP